MGHVLDNGELIRVLFDVSLKATVFAVAVELGIRYLRVKDASLSHSMWTAIASGMLLFPALHLYLPMISIPLIPSVVGAGDPAELIDPGWAFLLACVYAAGVVGLLARLAVGLAVGNKIVAASRPVHAPRWEQLCRREVPGRSWRRVPVIRESDLIRVPMTIGFARSFVLLPASWREWSDDKITSVLAHELAHARRGDFIWQLLGEINLCFFWFHPVAWLLRRRLSLAAERACDDSAILAVGDHCLYARHLVDIAGALEGRRGRVVAVGLPMAKPCQVRSRVESILDRNRKLSRRLGRGGIVFVVVLSSVVWVSAATVCWEKSTAAYDDALEALCPDAATATEASCSTE